MTALLLHSRLAVAGLVRNPGRTALRVTVVAAAVALLAGMLLFIGQSLRTASVKKTLKPGVRTKIKLSITARVRELINRQLKRGVRVVVRVTLSAVDSSGNRSPGKRTLTLLRR